MFNLLTFFFHFLSKSLNLAGRNLFRSGLRHSSSGWCPNSVGASESLSDVDVSSGPILSLILTLSVLLYRKGVWVYSLEERGVPCDLIISSLCCHPVALFLYDNKMLRIVRWG